MAFIKIGEKGLNYINDPYPVTLYKDHNFEEEEVKVEDDDRFSIRREARMLMMKRF